VSGNSIVLVVTGSGKRVAESFNGVSSSAPLLHIEFNDGGGNRRPTVNAGADAVLQLPDDTLNLDGTVTDDGLPVGGTLTTTWSHVGGTGTGAVSFGNPNAVDTTVTIDPVFGTYNLRLTANDGEFSVYDELVVTVGASNTAPTVTITAPANGSSFASGNTVSFSGTATDEDGDLSANLSWTSDVEGATPIGTGASFASTSLSEGTHVITASVSDSGSPSLTGQAQITLTVEVVTQRIPWTEQPPPGTPLDTQHPLYQHLIFFADFKDGAPFEHISQEYGVYNINAIGHAIEDIGIVGQFDDGQNDGGADFVKHDELHDGLAQVTSMSYAKRNNDSINSTESTMAYAGSGSDPWDISIAADGDLRFRIEILDTKSTDELTQSAGDYDLSEWNIMGGTWDGTTVVARANKVWGSGTASDTGTLSAGSAATNNPRLGQRQNGATDSWYGWVAFGAVWNIDIGDDWWSSLSDNPWQLYEPMEIPILIAD
jgi:hypothetical protein